MYKLSISISITENVQVQFKIGYYKKLNSCDPQLVKLLMKLKSFYGFKVLNWFEIKKNIKKGKKKKKRKKEERMGK